MNTDMESLVSAARQGDFTPLIDEAKNAPGKYWAKEARCADQDTEMFFPSEDSPFLDPQTVKKRLGGFPEGPRGLCRACPVAVAARCLVESLNDDEFGIRAGLLASERSAMRTAWQQHASNAAVQGALRGGTAVLTKAERDAVIAQFASDASLEAATVARALGVTHEYLLNLVRRHRQRPRALPPRRQPARPRAAA
ncbi:WhiB family transcriptional regulator [Streptomyces sp. NPDC060194]|uniref:WhiB family transcriptional regulator n=1 Tax=Streptomyces sp. NPDC060194 TaxID=3347069 RepID=UPI0036490BC9